MIAVTPRAFLGTPVASLPAASLSRVSLINRQTGRVHVIAGHPVATLTTDPEAAGQALLRNRDPRDWSARIEAAVI